MDQPSQTENLGAAAQLLREARRVVIGGHPSMDGDALGSMFALAACLRAAGRECLCVTQDLGPGKYAFLEGAADLAPLAGLPAMLEGFDTCIMVDCGAPSRAQAVLKRLPAATRVVNLDHHIDNPGFGHAAAVFAHASSTGEVVFNVLRAAGIALTRPAAEALFCAIVTDTGRFMFSNSTPASYRIVAELVERFGLDVADLTRRIYRSKSPGRIRLERMVAETLQVRMDGRVVVARVTQAMLDDTGGTDADANELVTIPQAVNGVMVCLLFREVGPSECKVSFRSEGQLAVNELAARFGGGGHLRAAGCHLRGRPLAQAEAEVIAATEAVLAETLRRTGGAIIA